MLSKKHKELNTQIKKEQAEALAKREADASLKIDKEISQTEGW